MQNLQDTLLKDTSIGESRAKNIKRIFARNGVDMGKTESTLHHLALLFRSYHQKITSFQENMIEAMKKDSDAPDIPVLLTKWDVMQDNQGDLIQSLGITGTREVAAALDTLGIDKDQFIQGKVIQTEHIAEQSSWSDRTSGGRLGRRQDVRSPGE